MAQREGIAMLPFLRGDKPQDVDGVYHINPETGDLEFCSWASALTCKFGPHYESIEEAKEAAIKFKSLSVSYRSKSKRNAPRKNPMEGYDRDGLIQLLWEEQPTEEQCFELISNWEHYYAIGLLNGEDEAAHITKEIFHGYPRNGLSMEAIGRLAGYIADKDTEFRNMSSAKDQDAWTKARLHITPIREGLKEIDVSNHYIPEELGSLPTNVAAACIRYSRKNQQNLSILYSMRKTESTDVDQAVLVAGDTEMIEYLASKTPYEKTALQIYYAGKPSREYNDQEELQRIIEDEMSNIPWYETPHDVNYFVNPDDPFRKREVRSVTHLELTARERASIPEKAKTESKGRVPTWQERVNAYIYDDPVPYTSDYGQDSDWEEKWATNVRAHKDNFDETKVSDRAKAIVRDRFPVIQEIERLDELQRQGILTPAMRLTKTLKSMKKDELLYWDQKDKEQDKIVEDLDFRWSQEKDKKKKKKLYEQLWQEKDKASEFFANKSRVNREYEVLESDSSLDRRFFDKDKLRELGIGPREFKLEAYFVGLDSPAQIKFEKGTTASFREDNKLPLKKSSTKFTVETYYDPETGMSHRPTAAERFAWRKFQLDERPRTWSVEPEPAPVVVDSNFIRNIEASRSTWKTASPEPDGPAIVDLTEESF